MKVLSAADLARNLTRVLDLTLRADRLVFICPCVIQNIADCAQAMIRRNENVAECCPSSTVKCDVRYCTNKSRASKNAQFKGHDHDQASLR